MTVSELTLVRIFATFFALLAVLRALECLSFVLGVYLLLCKKFWRPELLIYSLA